MARNIAQKLNEAWAQPVVVENRTGAGGIIGADAVAKSPPDGYTFLLGTTTTAINASLVVKPPYDMQRDLQPVAMLSFYPMAAVVLADSPVRSLQDLVALSHKQSLSAGSGGNGTPQHLVVEMFKGATGAKILHVPYKGGAPALVALLGAQNDVVFSLWPEALPHVQAGKLRALAVTTRARLAQMPDIPTTAEAGFPSVQATGWLDRRRVEDVLSRADLLLITSVFEGMPIAGFEAMAWGVPVIGYDVPGVRACIGDAGRLAPPGHPDHLARAVLELVRHRAARERASAAAFSRAAAHSWGQVARETLAAYELAQQLRSQAV